MATAVRDADIPGLRADLSAALRAIALLVTAAGTALAAAAVPFAAFFAHSPGEAREIGAVLLAFLVGLVPFSTLYVLLRAFYALGDTRTPFLLQVVQAALFIAATLALLAAPSDLKAIGIGLATSASGIVQAIVAAGLLRRRLGGGGGGLVRRFAVYALAAIPAAAAGIGVLALFGGFAANGFATAGRVEGLVTTAAVGAASILVYVGVLAATRAPELRALSALIRRR
jgi:putative peptidoglycan lipid II flippase